MFGIDASRIALLIAGLCLVACGGSRSSPRATEGAQSPPVAPSPDPTRPELTAEACEAGGGTIVADIGDGAIHREGYRCPKGSKPLGAIRAPEGGPIAVEGSVCCPR